MIEQIRAKSRGQWAVVTGASSGIGEACARQLAQAGYSLVLAARRKERLSALAVELGKSTNAEIVITELDVTDREAVSAWARANQATLKKVRVLVNSAGLAAGLDTFDTASLDDWEQMIQTNVMGLLYVTKAVLPFMLENNDGHIVNIGSVAGRHTYPKGNAYCASKAAVKSLNESLRVDLCGKAIRVTEISPGMVETEFSLVRLKDADKAKAVYKGIQALSAGDVADAVSWSIGRPAHVNIQEMVIYPTMQASPTVVHRS